MTKPCLSDIGIKLSKLVKKPLKVSFLKTEIVNLLFSLQILTSKNEKFFFFFHFKSEFVVSMFVINIINKFKLKVTKM